MTRNRIRYLLDLQPKCEVQSAALDDDSYTLEAFVNACEQTIKDVQTVSKRPLTPTLVFKARALL